MARQHSLQKGEGQCNMRSSSYSSGHSPECGSPLREGTFAGATWANTSLLVAGLYAGQGVPQGIVNTLGES